VMAWNNCIPAISTISFFQVSLLFQLIGANFRIPAMLRRKEIPFSVFLSKTALAVAKASKWISLRCVSMRRFVPMGMKTTARASWRMDVLCLAPSLTTIRWDASLVRHCGPHATL